MLKPTAILAIAALALAGCATSTAERAARDGLRNGLVGAALGAVAGAFNGNAGRGAGYGAAVGVTSGVVTAVVDDLIYGRSGDGHDVGRGSDDDYDWGPYPYDPARADAVLAGDRYSPDALGTPVAYPYGAAPGGAALPAGVIVANASPRPRDIAAGAPYRYDPYPAYPAQ